MDMEKGPVLANRAFFFAVEGVDEAVFNPFFTPRRCSCLQDAGRYPFAMTGTDKYPLLTAASGVPLHGGLAHHDPGQQAQKVHCWSTGRELMPNIPENNKGLEPLWFFSLTEDRCLSTGEKIIYGSLHRRSRIPIKLRTAKPGLC